MGCDWYTFTHQSFIGFPVTEDQLKNYEDILNPSRQYDVTDYVYFENGTWHRQYMIYDTQTYETIESEAVPGPHEITLEYHTSVVRRSNKMSNLLVETISDMKRVFSLNVEYRDCAYWIVLSSLDYRYIEELDSCS